eukprot:TRINITY_DN115_c0_g1_i1.p1 TRINITY_DN115_c0_g1~~TRINITY_DN115_c0_g1_i1.p1  ORF type:complete len:846 (-),score=258.84 TRINITY_DN115_c0_g1_i1:110-2647(-)
MAAADKASDAEKGQSAETLGPKELVLKDFGSNRYKSLNHGEPAVPVGGHPGNPKFCVNCELAVRLTAFAMMLGTLVWVPSVAETLGMERFTKHVPLAICLMVFFAAPTFGAVVNTATAGMAGAFMATLNIFILRGFFADGVTPGKGHFSVESIVGWTDLAFFNFFMLSGNFRPGFKITGMALNCGFMMCFLNPLDQTVFSKNFKINPNGAAVSAFLGTCMGSLCAVLALLLPYPLGWASKNMKTAAKQASEDMCKLFFAAVTYYKGDAASVLIDRQLAQAAALKTAIGGLGGNIDAAYIECLDVGTEGTVRNLYTIHSKMLGQIHDILNALQIAMSSEDFQDSHNKCMETIGDASEDLVEAASMLLIDATKFSEDGKIDGTDEQTLKNRQKHVKEAQKELAAAFAAARGHFAQENNGQSLSRDLLSEAFFVFCLTAFGRLVVEYADTLIDSSPKGQPLSQTLAESMRAILKPPLAYHSRVVSRYWLSLLTCFVFAVAIDGYSPSCAITAVFLINTRVGPDVMAMINGLLSVVVGIVMNTLMYSFSCKYGNTTVLMVVSVFYWFSTIFVAYGGSSLAGIGLIMAALAPFAILKRCMALTPEGEAAAAVGLWGGIRALLIAVVVTVIWEILHIPGSFTRMACDSMEHAFEGVEKAFKGLFDGEDVSGTLDEVGGFLGDAETYNAAAIMEPRLWKTKWKKEYLLETTGTLNKVKLDVLVMRLALKTKDAATDTVIKKYFSKVAAAGKMRADLETTLADAKKLALEVLRWECGEFTVLQKGLTTMEGLDTLEDMDDAIAGFNKVISCDPSKAPDSMEEDELCQLSIILVMLEYIIAHIADITKGAVRIA